MNKQRKHLNGKSCYNPFEAKECAACIEQALHKC